MLETTEIQAVSSDAAQTSISNAATRSLRELSAAYKLVNPEIYCIQIQAALHLTALDITAVCSPTHPICSYHSLVPLADLKNIFTLSAY